ncbi:MAG: glucose-1-phosphate adenylyltransferase [Deltaproteobacteria bacterium RIFOXYD12_FULL_57_12]|nr:MAG: glucose-1-phosphate adenylyltransferase [Deltaproteobacteria bacterium RIFOXYD12_FULL_57_12]
MTLMKPRTLAMILAGGRVDELNVLTYYRPKSAVPFGGFARVIDFPLSNLMHAGLERVAILSQYRSYSLINHIGIGAAWDMLGRHRGISILPPFKGSGKSQWYKGTADAVFQNLDFVQHHTPEEVLIISGDHIYQMDYRQIIAYHRAKDADLTIAFLPMPLDRAHRFGVAELDDEDGELGGRVLRYEEKPAKPEHSWASLTVFCFKPQVLYDVLAANARDDHSHEFGRDIIPRLLREGRKLYGFKFRGYWGYTRTIDEYWQTNMDLLGPAPRIRLEEWGIRTNLEHRGIRDCQPLKVGPAAVIQDSLVYNGCVVEGRVEHSILFPGVHVKPGAVVKDSVLFFNNVVEADAGLFKVVSDVNTLFGAGSVVGGSAAGLRQEVTVVGWNNQIPAGTVIGAGCTIYPHLPPGRLPKEVKTGEVVQC